MLLAQNFSVSNVTITLQELIEEAVGFKITNNTNTCTCTVSIS